MTRMTWNEERIPLLCKADHDHYPQVVRWTRAASGTTGWKRRSPLLGKGGVAAPSSKWSRSFGGAARSVSPVGRNIKNGVVRSTSDNRWLEPTTPSAPAKEASRHFLDGRSHPSLSKEGTSAFPSVVFNAPVSSKMWDMAKPVPGGEFHVPGPSPCLIGTQALSRVTGHPPRSASASQSRYCFSGASAQPPCRNPPTPLHSSREPESATS